MSSATLLRYAGLAATLAGILFLTWGYIHRDDAPSYFTIIVKTLALIVPLLFLLGLTGLYIRCAAREGWLGITGFAFSFIGSVWGILHGVVLMIFPDTFWLLSLSDWLPLMLSGFIVVGTATLRLKQLRGWGTLLLTMGSFGWVYRLHEEEAQGLPPHAQTLLRYPDRVKGGRFERVEVIGGCGGPLSA